MLYSTRMDRGGDPGHVTELVGAFEKKTAGHGLDQNVFYVFYFYSITFYDTYLYLKYIIICLWHCLIIIGLINILKSLKQYQLKNML